MAFKDLTFTKQADSGSGTLAVSMPATVVAGDILVAAVSCGKVASPPTGWTWVGGTIGTAGRGLALYKKTADGTEGGTTVQFDRRVGGAANACVVHAVGRYGGFTYVDTGGSATESRDASDEYADWSPVMLGTGVAHILFIANKYGLSANTSGSNIHGTPLATARGFDTQANGGGTEYCSLIWADLLDATGDYDPGLNFPPSEAAYPWAYLTEVSSNTSLVSADLYFNSPVAADQPGPSGFVALRLLRAEARELPYQLHTRMFDGT